MANRPDVSRVWASGSPNAIIDPDTRQSGKVVKGWEAEVPPFEYFNWIQNNNDLFKLALAERGIASWGNDVTYQKGALTFLDSDGKIYVAQKVNKGQTPVNNVEYWQKSGVQVTKADIDRLQQKIDNHLVDTNNPHRVTAEQINAYTKAQADALVNAVSDSLDNHKADKGNPHKVTAQQAGGVPIAGGTYTGQINTQANQMIIGKGKTTKVAKVNADSDNISLRYDNYEVGIKSGGYPYFFDGTIHKLIPEDQFAALKLLNEPKYAVPRPDFWMPLKSDINIYEGTGQTTFSRSSTATYVDKQGTLKYAQIDEPRFEKEGLLIEGSSTNMCPNSISNGLKGNLNWNSINVSGVVEKVASVDGKNNAIRITSSGAGQGFYLANILATQQPATVSCWVKLHSGQGSLLIGVDLDHATLPMSDKWTRFVYTTQANKGASPIFYSSEACVWDVCFVQVEELPFATSYIPTNGSPATRASDRLITSNMVVGASSTVSCDFNTISQNTVEDTSPRAFDISLGSKPNFLGVYLDADLNKVSFYSNKSGLVNTELTAPINTKVAIVTDAQTNRVKAYFGGKLTKDNPCSPEVVNMPFGIGCSAVNTFGQLNGHLSNFKFWNTALTEEQISTL